MKVITYIEFTVFLFTFYSGLQRCLSAPTCPSYFSNFYVPYPYYNFFGFISLPYWYYLALVYNCSLVLFDMPSAFQHPDEPVHVIPFPVSVVGSTGVTQYRCRQGHSQKFLAVSHVFSRGPKNVNLNNPCRVAGPTSSLRAHESFNLHSSPFGKPS